MGGMKLAGAARLRAAARATVRELSELDRLFGKRLVQRPRLQRRLDTERIDLVEGHLQLRREDIPARARAGGPCAA